MWWRGRLYLLTNHHVIRTREEAASTSVILDFYESNSLADAPRARLEPLLGFLTNVELDCTLVALQGVSRVGLALEKIKPSVRQIVTIYQHPGGKRRHRSTHEVCEVATNVLRYSVTLDMKRNSQGQILLRH